MDCGLWSHAAAAKSDQSCPTLCDSIDSSPPGSRPWDSPGNTGVGCHFLLQCMKVKSESEVAQSCPTLRDPMNCRLPGSSAHGISQTRVLEWVAIAFSTGAMLLGFKSWLQSCLTSVSLHFLTCTVEIILSNMKSGVTAPFTWVLVRTKFCLCPPRVCFPSPVEVL